MSSIIKNILVNILLVKFFVEANDEWFVLKNNQLIKNGKVEEDLTIVKFQDIQKKGDKTVLSTSDSKNTFFKDKTDKLFMIWPY